MNRKSVFVTFVLLAGLIVLVACSRSNSTTSTPTQTGENAVTTGQNDTTAVSAAESTVPAAPVSLDPSRGQEIGYVYEAYLTPQQEPGEEKDTPPYIPPVFQSTAPSLLRDERTGYGHAIIRFPYDLSKVYVDLELVNVKAEDVAMFHIHCGRPYELGPIILDFSLAQNLQESLADGKFSGVYTNKDIEAEIASGEGLIGAFTAGCPIIPGERGELVKTIAGMQYYAEEEELYFNLHTHGQVYFGDMRGQVHAVEP